MQISDGGNRMVYEDDEGFLKYLEVEYLEPEFIDVPEEITYDPYYFQDGGCAE